MVGAHGRERYGSVVIGSRRPLDVRKMIHAWGVVHLALQHVDSYRFHRPEGVGSVPDNDEGYSVAENRPNTEDGVVLERHRPGHGKVSRS